MAQDKVCISYFGNDASGRRSQDLIPVEEKQYQKLLGRASEYESGTLR